MRSALISFVLMLASFCAHAANKTEEDCPAKKEGIAWSRTCFETVGETRQVKAEYRDRIALKASGFETILVAEPIELVAVDRDGIVVVPGIAHTGDFDYPTADRGVGRFYSGDKCGYFQSKSFKIVIPATYDACFPFRDGTALVCRDCVSYCIEPECMNEKFVGGKGYRLNLRGNVVREFVPSPLDDACGPAGVAEVGKLYDTIPMIVCNPAPAPRLRR